MAVHLNGLVCLILGMVLISEKYVILLADIDAEIFLLSILNDLIKIPNLFEYTKLDDISMNILPSKVSGVVSPLIKC